MAHTVSTNSFDVFYPGYCPYCGNPDAESRFNQPFSKMGVGVIPGQVASKTWKVMLPACGSCARMFKLSRLGYFLAGFSALVLPIGIFAVPVHFQSFVAGLLVFLAFAWFVLLVYRKIKLRAFKVAYVGKGEVVFSSANQRYAEDFARLNNTSVEEKRFLLRLS